MPFVTSTDVIKFMWVSSVSTEVSDKINYLLDLTTGTIQNKIGNVIYNESLVERIPLSSILKSCDILLRSMNVRSINKLWWEDYVWISCEDLFIINPLNRRIKILDIWNYISNDQYLSGLLKVEYSAWYDYDPSADPVIDDIPQDIKTAQLLLIMYELQRDNWWSFLKKYVMWPRTIEYASAESIKIDAMSHLNKYKQFNLL